ncbi:MAG TPA: YggS family pyridoxal phosphate-dependent enzyme [Gammaproteobacteria bacterium]|nr:YggS family pyridoxal phosphate-dependent enzyme [Gammaproteobacteria bacterium]
MSRAEQGLLQVREQMAEAARRAGRTPESVRLIAVSKHHPPEAIRALAQAGQRAFGENQVQEALGKIEQLAGAGLEWHFIGHLQSNKTRYMGGCFHWLHTLDSLKLARRVEASAREAGVDIQALVQVNVSGDPAKHGVEPGQLLPLIEAILRESPSALRLRGLMTIGYRDAGPDRTRRSFAALREWLGRCRSAFGPDFSELSMGMSGDYPLAIEEGATMVRVGSALFGPRRA